MNKLYMKFIYRYLILFLLVFTGFAESRNVNGFVSGTWSISDSPIYVLGDIEVAWDSSLTIEAGVDVRFQGNYQFYIYGLLQANGTISDSIYFHRDLPTHAQWAGIKFRQANSSCIMSYCRIEDSYANRGGNEDYGGAIRISDCSPTIDHCLIINNTASQQGGGIFIHDLSEPVISNCTIRNNSALRGGGFVIQNSSPVFNDNLIILNTATNYGGGGMLESNSSSLTFKNNIIRGNIATTHYGGGLHITTNDGTFTLENNIFESNTAQYGGGIYLNYSYNVDLVNNLIYSNVAVQDGGGVASNHGNTSNVVNCTIYGNSATNGGGYYSFGSSNPVLTNCILWNNSSPTIYLFDLGTITVNYSDITGGYTGTGNINADPQFIDVSNGDFHIGENSPCIDAGTSTGAPSSDFDGNTTGQDGDNSSTNEYDMGVFEFLQEVQTFTSSSTTADYYLDTFESGTTNQVGSVSLNGTVSGSGDIVINCFTKSQPLDVPIGSKSVRRWYRITEDGDLSYGSAILRLYYNSEENVDNLNSSSLRLWRYAGGGWQQVSGDVTTGSNYVQIDGISQASLSGDWAFSDPTDSPLPVTLISFKVEQIKEDVLLTWETASEISNLGFEILRQNEGNPDLKVISNYKFNDNLKGLVNSSEGKSYSFLDQSIKISGKYYYLLKSYDINGAVNIYDTVEINVTKNTKITPDNIHISNNYPNPFNPETHFDIYIPQTMNMRFEVYNSIGQRLNDQKIKTVGPGSIVITWKSGKYPSGEYYYIITDLNNGNLLKSGKMVLIK